ncbi:Hypothetical Protein FCC1311_006562 [Hondaea fermentalgiana]|uniref:Uncharacterized protein n=1 Tax=Hondaea fermentalgiana TaxID=2315210 RepID=A0A2R5G3U6_9STRA|nr:Hypothetical Protein FCC1311_006562 [Hondaea fermentalgiana]|eukprot:GBG24438.1 Hypothetical Protein FCC1311_006562 [Hondaea fermentalgiana]
MLAAAGRRGLVLEARVSLRRPSTTRWLSAASQPSGAGSSAKQGPSNASHIVWASLAMALGIQVAQKTKQIKQMEAERAESGAPAADVVREVDVTRVKDLILAEDWTSAAKATAASSDPVETLQLKLRSAFDTVALRVATQEAFGEASADDSETK